MPGSFRMWRWLSALALVAVGLVMGASVAGAQDAPQRCRSGRRWGTPLPSPSQFHTNPGRFRDGPAAARGRLSRTRTSPPTGRARSPLGIDLHRRHGQLDRPGRAAHAVQRGLGHLDRDRRRPQLAQLHHSDRDGAARPVAASRRTPPGTSSTRQPPVTIGESRPATRCSASITRTARSNWTLSITDTTTGNNAGGLRCTYSGPGDSAEWIEELPDGRGLGAAHPGQLRLGDVHQHDVQPGRHRRHLTPIDMVDESGNVIASAGPTRRTESGSSFTDTYVPSQRGLLARRLRRRDLLLRLRPSSTGRPGACTCSDLSSASCRRRTTAATGSTPPTAASSPTATPSSTGPYPGSGSIPPVRGSRTASTRPLWAWSPPSTTTATSWWPPTAASSPSVTPTSPGPARASVAARARPWPSCPTPPGTATGS